MEDQLASIWREAWNSYDATLSVKERSQIEKIASLDELTAHVQRSRKEYYGSKRPNLSRILARAEPFIAHLRSFSNVIATFTQAHPEIASLVWGSLALVLEVCLDGTIFPCIDC
jgi:hypothetical protein